VRSRRLDLPVGRLTGLAVASDVLVDPGADERDTTVKTLGVLVVFCDGRLPVSQSVIARRRPAGISLRYQPPVGFGMLAKPLGTDSQVARPGGQKSTNARPITDDIGIVASVMSRWAA